EVDGAVREGDGGAVDVVAVAGPAARGARLALTVDRGDRVDLDVEDLLDGDLALGLVGAGSHQEGVLALVHQPVALLGDDRGQQDVAGVLVQRGRIDSYAAASSAAVDSETAFTK